MGTVSTLPSTVTLGAPAAERDIERGLEHYFVESDVFRRVLSGQTTVVLGNRGAGKSAIFQMLARRSRASGARVIELAPDDYSYEMLQRSMHSEQEGSWAKHGGLRRGLEVHPARHDHEGAVQEAGPFEERLRGRDPHSTSAITTTSPGWADLALISYLKRLEGLKIGNYDAQVKTRELERLYKLEEIRYLLPHLERALADQRVVVLVDELDHGWDSSEDAQAFIAGLFQAANWPQPALPNLRIYMSLRQELYENVPSLYEDAQKYRDLIETVSWTEPELLSLIARRLRYRLPALAEPPTTAAGPRCSPPSRGPAAASGSATSSNAPCTGPGK